MSTVSPYYELNKYSDQLQDCSCKLVSCNTWYKAPLGLLGLAASVIARVVEGAFMLLANAFLALKYMYVGAEKQPSISRPNANPPSVKQPPRTKRVAPEPRRLVLESRVPSNAVRHEQPLTLEQIVIHLPPPTSITKRDSLDERLQSSVEIPPLSIQEPLPVHSPSNPPLSSLPPIITLPPQSNPVLDMNFPPADELCSQMPHFDEDFATQALDKVTKTCGTKFQARAIAGLSALRANKVASIAAAGIAGVAAAGAISVAPSLLPIAGALAVSRWAWDKLRNN